VPSEHAFQLCFVTGAVAAFVGVAIVATIPRRRQERLEADTVSGAGRSVPVGEGAR